MSIAQMLGDIARETFVSSEDETLGDQLGVTVGEMLGMSFAFTYFLFIPY